MQIKKINEGYSFTSGLRSSLNRDPLLTNSLKSSQVESYVTTDGQSASLSWNKAPIWGLRPDFYYCQTVAGLLMWGALSDERTGLSFTSAADPRRRSHSRVRVPWDSRPYFTVSASRLPFSSPPTTRRVTVEVFDPAFTWGSYFAKSKWETLRLTSLPMWLTLTLLASIILLITPLHEPSRKHSFQQYLHCCTRIRCNGNVFTEPLARNGSTHYNIICIYFYASPFKRLDWN
jgi:hypothetical protein